MQEASLKTKGAVQVVVALFAQGPQAQVATLNDFCHEQTTVFWFAHPQAHGSSKNVCGAVQVVIGGLLLQMQAPPGPSGTFPGGHCE